MTQRNTELPIGIFDSGIGGLTVARQIHRVLPREDLVYLGDTARVPYGTKSPGTVARFACEDTAFLMRQNVKTVVVGCNTCSAWALPMLEKKFPVPVFGVILPGVVAALEQTSRRRIDTLILGCTHYPLLKKAIRRVVGEKVALVDSAESCAQFVRERLEQLNLLSVHRRRPGVIRPFVTDEAGRFAEQAMRFLGFATEPAREVELPSV